MPDRPEFLDVADHKKEQHYYHRLETFDGSFAMLSLQPKVRRAVVFVHGFGGDAYGTWSQFQLLIDQVESVSSAFADVDLYFFQYHSVWAWIQTSSKA